MLLQEQLTRHLVKEVLVSKNKQIFKTIKSTLDEANLEIGKARGEAPDAEGTGQRFSHLMAIAPNASSSIIMGNTSPSIEPYRANAYRQDTLSGSHLHKNKFLDKIIKDKCKADSKLDYDEIWSSIIANDGSVQHLDKLSDWERDVFKTSMEIDQRWLIQHAAERHHTLKLLILEKMLILNMYMQYITWRGKVDLKRCTIVVQRKLVRLIK